MYTLSTATKEFLNHCQYEKNLSTKTLKAYRIDLTQLFQYLHANKLPLAINDITKVELRMYLEKISTLKPKSIKRKVATIKAMFNFLEFEDKISISPIRKMRINIKEPKRLPKVLNIAEIQEIFKVAYNQKNKDLNTDAYRYFEVLRNIVVIELLFATGARVSEIANLYTDNVDLESGSVILKGKGDKERVIQICNVESIRILKAYKKLLMKRGANISTFFLINRLGNKLSDQSVRGIVKRFSINAGISRNITPHVFRHSFATLLLEKDVDIKYIQLLLGHSSIMTTQIYTHVNREKQTQILKLKHPRRELHMH